MRSFIALSRVSSIVFALSLLGCTCPPPSSNKTEAPASNPTPTTDRPAPPKSTDIPPGPTDGTTDPAAPDPDENGSGESLPLQGMPCAKGQCSEGLTCTTYYGIAGPNGPAFTSCEIPCAQGGDAACPDGQACITIADGPGQVCRPRNQ